MAATKEADSLSLSDALVEIFTDLGVDAAFGILGGSVAPIYDAVGRSRIRLIHCRNESGAAFAAMESYFASGRPALSFATTGPGVVNTMTGITAARWEGAKMIFVSGTTPALHRGRWAFQETSAYTMPGLFTSGPLFDYAVSLEDVGELDEIAARLSAGLTKPGGFVAGIGVPVMLQRTITARRRRMTYRAASWGYDPGATAECAAKLAEESFVILVGFGAREASAEVRALAEHTSARVIATPRAKGIFPEDHPLYLGVSGSGGHAHVGAYLKEHKPARLLVLGSRLSELSTFWDPSLVPEVEIIHVDVDPEAPGTAFPNARTYAIHADIGAFARALVERMPSVPAEQLRIADAPAAIVALPHSGRPVRSARLLEEIQTHVVDGSDAVVLAEAGNSIVWAVHSLRFREPGRFRVSNRFGSMGHATTGVIGAAVGRNGKAVALVGDGAMLMVNEINTAATYGIPAVWIVMNNARYAMTHEGMSAVGFEPRHTEFREVDFAAMARSMGCDARRVEHESELPDALRSALQAKGPFVIDVLVDRDEHAPATRRNDSLKAQWRPKQA